MLPALQDKDPTDLGFPPMLPFELASKTGTVKEICESYGIDRDRYEALKTNQAFIRACEDAVKTLETDGGAFKTKIKSMAEAALPHMMRLIEVEDPMVSPPAVRADMIKTAIRVAGLDASIEQKAAAGKTQVANAVQIHIDLS